MTPLQESIKHWERMRDNKALPGETPQAEWCALCQASKDEDGVITCKNCPVSHKTGLGNCNSTPYYEAHWAYLTHGLDSPKFRKTAQAEINFLKSLEPTDAPA
mgnify:CR=1 FL=1